MAPTTRVFFPSMVQSQVSEMRCVDPSLDESIWRNFNKAFEKMN